ncbi:ABC transporter substrate-binding protein [Cytobacillus dafuensis]|uniref:ABC transporter substrate-binding protein n=1 Tax=Cytobacillus dafuensis TaxID=1742359 RepID=A0A5B8Z547_CYTDA|nr:ABC transporter substrate-binding protein [Cytobacillus dafuensis]QED48028.1 ABC transporter substrate-binding protein [Cytobacillus dafuensis]
MKKTLLSLIVIVFTFSILAACTNTSNPSESSTQSSNKPIELTFMHILGGDQGKSIEKIADNFNKSQTKYVVKPVFESGNYEGLVEKLQALLVTKKLPDVVMSGLNFTNYFNDNMPIVPAQTFIDKEQTDLSDFYPNMLELGKGKDGKQYAMPFAVSTPVLYYNKDMFKKAGLDPENPPKTFEEVREAAKTLTAGDQYGMFYDYTISGAWMFQAMVETMGGQMAADDGKSVAFNSEPGKKALQHWVDLVNNDKSMPKMVGSQPLQSFTSGKLGMYAYSTGALNQIEDASNFELGVAPFPTDGDQQRKIPAGGNTLYVMKSTPEKEKGAWEFIKYATSTEGTTIVAKEMGYMATRKSAVEGQELGAYFKENPLAKVTYTQLEDMVPWNNYSGADGTRIYKVIQDNIDAALNNQKTVDQAIEDAAKEANNLLK